MNASAKLAGFAVALAVTFGASYGVGRAVGPVGAANSGSPAHHGPVTTSTAPAVSGHQHGG